MNESGIELYASLVREHDANERFNIDKRRHPDLTMIRYHEKPDLCAFFHVNEKNAAFITIYRSRIDNRSLCASKQSRLSHDYLTELIYFAHELGHFYSWRNDPHSWCSEKPRIRRKGFFEETLAWELGRLILKRRDFMDEKRFELVQSQRLLEYKEGYRVSRGDFRKISRRAITRAKQIMIELAT